MKTALTNEDIIKQLQDIVTELDARELSFNLVISSLAGYSWKELCNKGIELLEVLRDGGVEQ